MAKQTNTPEDWRILAERDMTAIYSVPSGNRHYGIAVSGAFALPNVGYRYARQAAATPERIVSDAASALLTICNIYITNKVCK